jgi:alpha-tubulin suppressor-like RCC1 family protein
MILLKCKEMKISMNNYKLINDKFFKSKLNKLLSIPGESSNNLHLPNLPFNSFEFNLETKLISITSDKNFIYLLSSNNKTTDSRDAQLQKPLISLYKIGSGFNQTLINKVYSEKIFNFNFEQSKQSLKIKDNQAPTNLLRLINNENKNELIILLSNPQGKGLILTTISKDSFNIQREELLLDNEEIFYIFNNEKNIFIITKNSKGTVKTDGMMDGIFIEEKDKFDFKLFSLNFNSFKIEEIDHSPSGVSGSSQNKIKEKDFRTITDFLIRLKNPTYLSYLNKNILLINQESTSGSILNLKCPNFLKPKISYETFSQGMKFDDLNFNKFHNFILSAKIKEGGIITFDYYANYLSSPFEKIKNFSKIKKASKKILNEKYGLHQVPYKITGSTSSLKSYSNQSLSSGSSNKNVTNYLIKKFTGTGTGNSKLTQALSPQDDLKFHIDFDSNSDGLLYSSAYFNLLYSYLARHILLFGNLKNNFKRYYEYNKLQACYSLAYNKSLNNNISQEVFDIIWERSLSKINDKDLYSLSENEFLCDLIFLKSYLKNLIDINVDLNIYLENNLKNVFSFIFDIVLKSYKINRKISEIANEVLTILLKNTNFLKDNPEYINNLLEIVNDKQKGIENKLTFLNLILGHYENSKIDLKLIENIIKFEIELISIFTTSGAVGEKNTTNNNLTENLISSSFEFFSNFKKIFFKFYMNDILNINLNEENSNVVKIFEIVVENIKSLFMSGTLSNLSYLYPSGAEDHNINNNNNNYVTNISSNLALLSQFLNSYSFLLHLFLFFINIIMTKSEGQVEKTAPIFSTEKFPFRYLEKIINIIILLDKEMPNLNIVENNHSPRGGEKNTTNSENTKNLISTPTPMQSYPEKPTFNNLKEKLYIFETEHPCENDNKRQINFNFPPNEKINFRFDSMSHMSTFPNGTGSKVSLQFKGGESFGPFNTNFPTEEISVQTSKEQTNLLLNYEPHNLGKETEGFDLSYGFKLKVSNSQSSSSQNILPTYDILTDIRRSLIFSVCRLIQNTLIQSKGLKDKIRPRENLKPDFFKKEANLYKALFSSKLLDNISILKLKSENLLGCSSCYSHKVQNDYYQDLERTIYGIQINEEGEEKPQNSEKPEKLHNSNLYDFFSDIKSECKKYLKDNSYSSSSGQDLNPEIAKEVNKIISGVLKNSDDYYKRGFALLQKFFLLRNIWGNTGGKEIEHLIIFLFMIILKHEKMIVRYQEYLDHLSSGGVYETINSGNIHEIKNFDYFLKIFSEVSKIRIWFNEKKMLIAEYITNVRNNLDSTKISNPMLSEDTPNSDQALEHEVDTEICNYILTITKKAEFLLEALNISLEEEANKKIDSISPRQKNKEYTPNVQDLVNNLLIYIKTDQVEIEKIIEKISHQNEKAVNKETALILYNILLTIVKNNQQDLRDILYFMNSTFKSPYNEDGIYSNYESTSALIYFNKDITGADSAYIERVKVQFYNFLSILMKKIYIPTPVKKNFNLESSKYENMTHLVLAQSLIWKIKKRDYLFLKNSHFFEIFEKNSIFAEILSKNLNSNSESEIGDNSDLGAINSLNNLEESQYGKECVDFRLLQTALNTVLNIYSLQVFDKLNDEVIVEKSDNLFDISRMQGFKSSGNTSLISPRGATCLLSQIRKRSELNEFESFKIIDKISDVILNEFEKYLQSMRNLIEDDSTINTFNTSNNQNTNSELYSENKLNSYLTLLYRGISFNSILINHFMKRNSDFLAQLLEMFLVSSDKNKYFLIKFISLFTLIKSHSHAQSHFDEFLNTSMDVFRSSLERRFPDFYNFIISSEDNTRDNSNFKFYVTFLFKLIVCLLNDENKEYQFFFRSENDKELAWQVIDYIRNILLHEDSILKSEIILYLKSLMQSKNLLMERNVMLIILGADFNPSRVGSKVLVNVTLSENKKSELNNLHEYESGLGIGIGNNTSNTHSQSHSHTRNEKLQDENENKFFNNNLKTDQKKIGVIMGFTDNPKNPFIIDETITDFSFEPFSYSKAKMYALVVLEENLTRENIKTLAFDTQLIETENLVHVEENKILNEIILECDILPYLVNLILLNVDNDNDNENKISTFIPHNEIYLTLKLLKNILFSNSNELVEKFNNYLTKEKNWESMIKIISNFSMLSYNFKCKQISLEKLEKVSLNEILMPWQDTENLKGKNTHSSLANSTDMSNTSGSSSVTKTENSAMVCPGNKCIAIKYNNNLIREIPFLKMIYKTNSQNFKQDVYYNILKFTTLEDLRQSNNLNKNYTIMFIDSDTIIKQENFSEFLQILVNNKISAIITNEQLINKKEFFDKNLPLNTEEGNKINLDLAIVIISDTDYYSCNSFLFEQIPNEEFEELFLQSMMRDFSSLIDIPPMMVDETVRFGQRDLVLKILNEETKGEKLSNEINEKISMSKDTSKQIETLSKLISLISRRILIFILSKFSENTKCYTDVTQFMKIFKLLIFENNLVTLDNRNKLHANPYREIVSLIKFFLNSLTKISSIQNEFDYQVASQILDLSFINKLNYIDYNLIANVDSEEDLIKFENIENNLKLKFATLKVITQSGQSLVKDYEMKLFHALIIKIDDFLIKNKVTGVFVLEVLMILLQQIYENILTSETQSNYVNSIRNFTFLFRSEEFLRIASRAKEIFDKKDLHTLKIEILESKIINFFIIFLDLALLVFTRYDIDLNLDYFFNSKMMNLYFSYSLLTKKFKSLEFFILFCQLRDIPYVQSKNVEKIKYDFYYRDKNFLTPHIMKFQFEMADGVNIKLLKRGNTSNVKTSQFDKYLDIDPNSLVMLYSDKSLSPYYLQEYFNLEDINKSTFIKNQNGNTFYISLPYSDINHSLWGSGSNENQSLGCSGESGKYYGIPQKATGIESKNLKSFKFGYYHCFVATTDDKLYVCGKDYASSLRDYSRECASYTLDSHFNDIVSKEGIDNIWVNNYNATILLTKQGKLYGCGVNTDNCLTSKMQINHSTNIPFELNPVNGKIKMVSCGFKTSMIVLEDGSALTVGCNTYNECGNLETNAINYNYYHLNPPEGAKIIDAVAGEHFFLLLIQEKNEKVRLYSMGSNENGRCGVDTDSSHKLQKCKGVENLEFKLIASRNLSSAAVTTKGYLYTFGCNENGNLGHGTSNSDYYRPTLVESLVDYIVDEVSISHNHMLVVARDRVKGEKHLFAAGTNQYGSLCFEDLSIRAKLPKKITYFNEKQTQLVPVRLATSRYQSYILTIESKIGQSKNNFNQECKYCNGFIKDVMYVKPVTIVNKITPSSTNEININNQPLDLAYEFYCENCVESKIGSEILYMLNTPTKNLKNLQSNMLLQSKQIINLLDGETSNITLSLSDQSKGILYLDSNNFQHSETNQNFSYQCVDCFLPIKSKVYISTENKELVLCAKCVNSCSNKIEYPQVFYAMNKLRIDSISLRSKLPLTYLSSILYNIEKLPEPYMSIEITPKPSQIQEIRQLSKEKSLFELFSKWKRMNNSYLVELNSLKDEIDQMNRDGKIKGLTSAAEISKLINYLHKETEESKYPLLKSITKHNDKNDKNDDPHLYVELQLLNELSSSINECIFYMMNFTYNIKEKGFMHKAITDNLTLVSSTARLNIFHERINKLKITINANEREMPINRLKALRFYEKKTIDTTGEFTIFGQLFHKMKKYPLQNFLCKKDNRLFVVNLVGEGATDYGGPYREVLSTACEELHSVHLDLFIKSPNNRNEVGALRDKYVPNPSAKSAMLIDMFFFIGCLIGYAISSGQLLNLNIHPIIWKLILNHLVTFEEFESVDKLFFKYISEIEKYKGSQSEFELIFDQFFMIQLSDGSEYELIPGGRKIPVTVENKDKFVSLAKSARLNEFKVQVESIRYGLM